MKDEILGNLNSSISDVFISIVLKNVDVFSPIIEHLS